MSNYKENQFIKTYGVYLPAIIKEIGKSKNPLQSVFEAFTNSLEAIKLKDQKKGGSFEENIISISLYFTKDIFKNRVFQKILVEDNGIGFNDEQFERFLTLKDNRKGFQNKGSGRVQYIQFFSKCEITSVFEENSEFYERSFSISKSEAYLKNNSIVKHIYTKKTDKNLPKTTLLLTESLDDSLNSKFNISITNLKIELVKRYLGYLCIHRDELPTIVLKEYVENSLENTLKIEKSDIPVPDKVENFEVSYSAITDDYIVKENESEVFKLFSFKLDQMNLDRNDIFLLSKGERIEDKNVKLSFKSISPEDSLEGKRFLILISGDYISSKDGDERGTLSLLKKNDFLKNKIFYEGKKEILFEDIEDNVEEIIERLYPEIKMKNEEKRNKIEVIKKMFLFNDEVLADLSINFNDSEDKIIEKFHKAESKISAKRDVEIFNQVDLLEELDPSEKNFDKKLDSVVEKLTKEIPLQNRTSLTHYVARRKIIIELFQKVLERRLLVQNNTIRNNDEQLLHNILFKQSTSDPNNSDLWLINEDFVYFSGTSESLIKDIEIDGDKIIKNDLTDEELIYIKSLEENRLIKRTDILLFPEESKCIIIELKNPNVNVSEHLNQINRYATLLRNLTKDKYNFDTFYGYLIGEKMNAEDIRDFDSDFKNAYNFDYVFRPKKDIVGKNGRPDGSLYTEVIKYTTLLERAKKRNEIFIEKLKIDVKSI